MKNFKNILFAVAFSVVLFATSCQQPGANSTGSEFIPDMAHSVAYEANVLTDYHLNTFEDESVAGRRELSQPRLPVSGTMPRGFSGAAATGRKFESAEDAVKYTLTALEKYGEDVFAPNGFVPYYYEDSDSGRAQATAELIYNPFPITAEGLTKGKELYNIMCGICHGEKGDGNGYLVSEDNLNAKYPAQPRNFLLPDYVAASNGQYYHSIMHGINVMGGYADKLSYEERWNVIHYIRALQAKELKVAYDENSNTLNPDFGVPFASLEDWTLAMNSSQESGDDGVNHNDHSEGEHSHDGDSHGGEGHEH
jgi:mono/diheme cytochrome c family protein